MIERHRYRGAELSRNMPICQCGTGSVYFSCLNILTKQGRRRENRGSKAGRDRQSMPVQAIHFQWITPHFHTVLQSYLIAELIHIAENSI